MYGGGVNKGGWGVNGYGGGVKECWKIFKEFITLATWLFFRTYLLLTDFSPLKGLVSKQNRKIEIF